MKKLKFGAVVASTLGALMLIAACGEGGAVGATQIDFYSGDRVDARGKMVFNEELFYVNEHKGPGPDPFVFDNTSRDGYYYIGSTLGELSLYRTKDMMTIEPVGASFIPKDDVQKNATADSRWAPEYLYDEVDGCYYMFFSAKPSDTANGFSSAGKGVVDGVGYNIAYLGRSDKPEGPYELVDFTSTEAVEGGWAHDLNAAGNVNLTEEDVEAGIWGVNESGRLTKPTASNYAQLYKPSYPHAYAKYAYLDPMMFASAGMSIGKVEAQSRGGFSNSIDLHPFIDPDTGVKYLYWTMNSNRNFIVGLQMKVEEDGSSSWLKPDWSTFTRITVANYWTIADYDNGKLMNENGEPCYDEGSNINEGSTMLKHNGLYYLTFSIGRYEDNTYEVCQAVADSPLGAFRKLREEENGRLLSGQLEGSEEMSGTGHHSIINIGDQMFIYYHSHDSYVAMGANRHGNLDELHWITIEDIYGEELDVLVANGPTATIQPRVEAYAKYVNLAEDATVKLTDNSALAADSDLSWVNDGLLSVFKNGNVDFYDTYIQETRITKTATFEFTLAKASKVRAVMVYDSKYERETFLTISRMEFTAKDGQIYYLEGVELPKVYYSQSAVTGAVNYVAPGAAAFAEFYELADIQTVKITVEVPARQSAVGISEIRILGSK